MVKKTLVGKVIKCSMDKTIVVKIIRRVSHPLYNKIINRATKIHAHDEKNECRIGDVVRIAESRPISKTKAWILIGIESKS